MSSVTRILGSAPRLTGILGTLALAGPFSVALAGQEVQLGLDWQHPRSLQITPPSGFLRLDSKPSQAFAWRGSLDLWRLGPQQVVEVTAAYRFSSERQLTYANSTGASGDVQARLHLVSQQILGFGYRFEHPWKCPLDVGFGLEVRRERLAMKDGDSSSVGTVTRPWLLAKLRHRLQSDGFGPFLVLEFARPLTLASTPSGVAYLQDLDHLERSPNPGCAAKAHASTFGLTLALGYRFGARPMLPRVSTQSTWIEPLPPMVPRTPMSLPLEPSVIQAPQPEPATAQPTVIVLDEASLHFALNRSEIPAQGISVLKTWVAQIKTRQAGSSLSVVGHSDSTGSRPHNLRLSLARAQAVAGFLRSEGLDVCRVEGLGSDHPLTSNDLPEGRAKNRRVEIHLEGAESQSQIKSDLVPELPKSQKPLKK